MLNKKIKTLKVGILGEPNTGKSTLFNTLINKKYSIVTRKAQTTIKKNSAVLARKNKQIIFTGTPGVITYKKNIQAAQVLKWHQNKVVLGSGWVSCAPNFCTGYHSPPYCTTPTRSESNLGAKYPI